MVNPAVNAQLESGLVSVSEMNGTSGSHPSEIQRTYDSARVRIWTATVIVTSLPSLDGEIKRNIAVVRLDYIQ